MDNGQVRSEQELDQSKIGAEWKHPTGNNPKSIMILALGPSKLHFLEDTTKHVPPSAYMNVDEVWGINGGVNWIGGRVAYDMLWVMDYLDGEAVKEPKYTDYIRSWMDRFDAPVMTSEAGSWGLDSRVKEYPLRLIEEFYKIDRPYFHNSIPYMLAYAGFIGVKSIVLVGADYHHEELKNREDDRPCAEYWIGKIETMGVKILLPSSTTLCNANQGIWYYGYRNKSVC